MNSSGRTMEIGAFAISLLEDDGEEFFLTEKSQLSLLECLEIAEELGELENAVQSLVRLIYTLEVEEESLSAGTAIRSVLASHEASKEFLERSLERFNGDEARCAARRFAEFRAQQTGHAAPMFGEEQVTPAGAVALSSLGFARRA